MYSKEEATRLKQEFWITFGRYMKPIPSADGYPVNWINYKTGIKHLFIKMDADQYRGIISITITHPDRVTRSLYYQQLVSLKALFTDQMGEEWSWDPEVLNDNGVPLAQVSKQISEVNIFNQQTWPALISFLKPRIISLDAFWSDVKPIFENLKEQQ